MTEIIQEEKLKLPTQEECMMPLPKEMLDVALYSGRPEYAGIAQMYNLFYRRRIKNYEGD